MKTFSHDIVLIGAGKMGLALLKGWLHAGLNTKHVHVVDPFASEDLHTLNKHYGFEYSPVLPQNISEKIVVLATKPQNASQVLEAIAQKGTPSLLVSICAGTSLTRLSAPFTTALAVVRTMPNTPAAIGEGITAGVANAHVSTEQKQTTEKLFAATGPWLWLNTEEQIDAVTALSGSGPAYFFALVEAMASAGETLGLTQQEAYILAEQTFIGSAALLKNTKQSATLLREQVTSPNGTTAAALVHLQDAHSGLPPLLIKAMQAAQKRAQELS